MANASASAYLVTMPNTDATAIASSRAPGAHPCAKHFACVIGLYLGRRQRRLLKEAQRRHETFRQRRRPEVTDGIVDQSPRHSLGGDRSVSSDADGHEFHFATTGQ